MLIQGDQYNVYDKLTENGEPIDVSTVKKVKFMFGANVIKYYVADDENSKVTYDDVEKVFVIPLTQEDTLRLDSRFRYQVAVMYINDEVYHSLIKTMSIEDVVSREVIL